MYQGYNQAELGQMRSTAARQNATMMANVSRLGAPASMLQAMAGNTAAANMQNIAARSAAMDRAGRAADLSAADQLAGQVGRYRYSSAENDQAYRDMIERTLGETISGERTARRNSLAEMGQLGMYAGISPELWGIGIGGGGSNGGGSNLWGYGNAPEGTTAGMDSSGYAVSRAPQ